VAPDLAFRLAAAFHLSLRPVLLLPQNEHPFQIFGHLLRLVFRRFHHFKRCELLVLGDLGHGVLHLEGRLLNNQSNKITTNNYHLTYVGPLPLPSLLKFKTNQSRFLPSSLTYIVAVLELHIRTSLCACFRRRTEACLLTPWTLCGSSTKKNNTCKSWWYLLLVPVVRCTCARHLSTLLLLCTLCFGTHSPPSTV
jgi:hypothetical protein